MVRSALVIVALIAALAAPALAQLEEEAVPSPITATPSLLGPTGCIVTPTTEVPRPSYTIGFHWVDDTFQGIAKVNVVPIDQLEVGGAWIDPDDPTEDEQWALYAKYLLLPEEEEAPSFAVGVWDIGDQWDQSFYGVIGKTFKGEVPIIVNLGASSGDVVDGFFANLAIRLRPEIDALAEWDGNEANFGLRARPYKGLTVEALTVVNEDDDREFGLGVSYLAEF